MLHKVGTRGPWLSLAALVLALTAWPAAPAAADWTDPERLTQPGTYSNGLHVVHTDAGETVAAWVEQDQDDPFPMRLAVAVKPADGPLETVQILADELAGCVLDVASDAAGNVAVSWQTPDGTIRVARRPAGGSFGPVETVREGRGGLGGSTSTPHLSMSPDGDLAVTWMLWQNAYDAGAETPRMTAMAAISRDGAPFEAPVALTEQVPDGGWSHDSVITAAGELVVVWAETHEDATNPGWVLSAPSRVHAVWRSAAGVNSDVQTLTETPNYVSCPRVAADASGRVATIWHEVEPVQCASGGFYKVALRMPGEPFANPAVVPGSSNSAAGGTLEMDAAGNMSIAFNSGDDPAGIRVVSGPFGGPLEVTHSMGGGVADAAAAPGGTVVGRVPYPYAWGEPVEVGRLASEGGFSSASDVRKDCAGVE